MQLPQHVGRSLNITVENCLKEICEHKSPEVKDAIFRIVTHASFYHQPSAGYYNKFVTDEGAVNCVPVASWAVFTRDVCAFFVTEIEEQLKNLSGNHKTVWERLNSELQKVLHEYDKLEQTLSTIPPEDLAGTWGRNKDDFAEVLPTAKYEEVESKFTRNIHVVLVIENGKLLRLITLSTIAKNESKKPLAGQMGVEEKDIINFTEDQHMRLIYDRLLVNNKDPKVKQIVVRFRNNTYGIVSEDEAWSWHRKEPPPPLPE